MLGRMICNKFDIKPKEAILLIDDERISEKMDLEEYHRETDIWFVRYQSAHEYRRDCAERNLQDDDIGILIATSDQFVPYDLFTKLRVVTIGWEILFPNLNREALQLRTKHEINILSNTYEKISGTYASRAETEKVLAEQVFTRKQLQSYFDEEIREMAQNICLHLDQQGIDLDFLELNALVENARRLGYAPDTTPFLDAAKESSNAIQRWRSS